VRRDQNGMRTRTFDGGLGESAQEMWVDGVWVGPRSLLFFLGANRFFVAWCLLIVNGIALGIWVEVVDVPSWSVPQLTIVTGTGLTVAFMFCFSRGWVREGD
jgi:hypothetical protein